MKCKIFKQGNACESRQIFLFFLALPWFWTFSDENRRIKAASHLCVCCPLNCGGTKGLSLFHQFGIFEYPLSWLCVLRKTTSLEPAPQSCLSCLLQFTSPIGFFGYIQMKEFPKVAQLKGYLPGQLQINCTPLTIKSTNAKERVGGRVHFSLAGGRQLFPSTCPVFRHN